LSKETAANEIITNDCKYTSGATENSEPFWKADLDQVSKVKQVKIFNTLNGADSSLLASAEVWVGETYCGKLPKAPKLETTISVQCQSEDGQGILGSSIEIRGHQVGTMMICNPQVFAAVDSPSTKSSLTDQYSQCLSWQSDCSTQFSAPLDIENKLICLDRYG
jgi:hypothetical protein